MLVADYAKLSNKFVLVIDNTKYHTLAADKKATVLTYYTSILPEAEIDRIFELEYTYYYFDQEIPATDAAFDWFPQPQNVPDPWMLQHLQLQAILREHPIPADQMQYLGEREYTTEYNAHPEYHGKQMPWYLIGGQHEVPVCDIQDVQGTDDA